MATASGKLLEISTLDSGATARLHLLSTFKGRVNHYENIDSTSQLEADISTASQELTTDLSASQNSLTISVNSTADLEASI